MNTKKSKNKSKHKPSSNQAQTTQTKSENVELKTENIEVKITEEINDPVQQSVELKSEKPILLVSETVNPPPDIKVSESDTPKKPKRNRGKKKKTDTENDDDIIDDKIKEYVTTTPKEEIITEIHESTKKADVDSEEKDTPEIAPAARKKKNKNKKLPEITDKPKEEVTFTPLNKEELEDVKIVTLIPVQTESEENKSKKKNKKKKRSDSEKSDRTEDILSCTAAFQKLLEVSDKQEIKKDNKLDEAKQMPKVEAALTTTVESNKEEINTDNKIDEVKQVSRVETTLTTPINECLKMQTKAADIQQIETENSGHKEESCQSKKKNKKEKKQLPKEENVENTSKIDEKVIPLNTQETVVTIINICKDPENIAAFNVDTQDQTSQQLISQETTLAEKEKSPKPKAKIAKPVEKKRKDKTEISSKEDLAEVTCHTEKNIFSETEETVPLKLKTPEKTVEMIEFASELQRSIAEKVKKNKFVDSAVQSKDFKDEKEKNVSGNHSKNKGNKNKHESSESTNIKEVLEEEISIANIKCDENKKITKESKVAIIHSEKAKEAKEKEIKPVGTLPESVTSKSVAIPLGFKIPVQEDEAKIIVTPELDITQETTTESQKAEALTAALQVPEISMGKKRKKSPKRTKGENKQTHSSVDISMQVLLSPVETKAQGSDIKKIENKSCTLDTSKNVQEDTKKRSESYSELPHLEDIEIRSVKTEESESSTCDITPEIHSPRASSQLLDDNNNMVIRDITAVETKLNIPVVLPDTPFGQFVDSPLSSPKLVPLDIPSAIPTSSKLDTESTFKTSKDNIRKTGEKTDLKSKVLDVNQGMEELRKSIERSLAELSAMEKNEKEAEEHFAKAQSKLEEIQEIAAKKSEAKATAQSEAIQKMSQKIFENKVITEVKEKDEPEIIIKSKPQEQIKTSDTKLEESFQSPVLPTPPPPPPPPPARKDDKGKNKKKDKKGKQAIEPISSGIATSALKESSSSSTEKRDSHEKKEEKSEHKTEGQEKSKQQTDSMVNDNTTENVLQKDQRQDTEQLKFEPIERFEDALTSSIDDVNKTFEIIADEASEQPQNPETNVTAPIEDDDKKDTKQEKDNPVSQPKNLLGHPNIPARLNKTDYKKEKDKIPNNKQAKVKIKDDMPVEVTKESKESQTENKRRFLKDKTVTESIGSVVNENEEYVYKYSFRKVFLPSACHVCKKDLKTSRVPCGFCNLIFYCSTKHKDEDCSQHQALCFAVSTIVHLKDQKHIYADTKAIVGQDYRLLRMQMIMSCEKVLNRRLVPLEQEALLYPRLCADSECREWQQSKLKDCEGCGQISYCSDNPDHLPKSHQRWCKSYSLYHRLVVYQQTKGRLEPKLPTRVMDELYQVPEKLNEVLASMFEEKIDMTDIQYAALTQIATAPLTAVYCQQLYNAKMNAIYANGVHKKSTFTIHVVGAELQFEADALNKWEIFFLHLRPDVKDLRVVLIGSDLNPSKLPLDLLGKIKLCENCRQNKRRLLFDFEENKTYSQYWSSDCSIPDLVCAFNPSIQRSSILNGKDTWPATLKCILKLRVPFIITSYTMNEIIKDLARVKQCYEKDFNVISEPKFNPFASVRPDRNFISDDEMPLMFKNFCFAVISGSF